MKALQLEYPVDEHLKPVKDSDSVSTSMEISTTKLRVKDFEVTGTATGITHTDDTKLPLAGGTMTGNVDFGDSRITNLQRMSFNDGSGFITELIDNDDMSSTSSTKVSSSESIKAYVDNTHKYQYHTLFCGMNYNLSGGTQCIIPLGGGTRPATAFTSLSESLTFIAPFDGTLEKCLFRSEEVSGATVIGLHKAEDNTEVPSMTAECTVSVTFSVDDTSAEFDFSGVSDNDFSAGDVLGFTVDPANDVNDSIFTAVLKYDVTT